MMFITRHAAMNEPMLSVEEEREAVRNWQDKGDRDALELLIRSHARQVYAQASRWSDNPSHREDMVAEGMIGLMRAADNFDLSQDVRFSTYAGWWVLNGVSSAMVKIKTVVDIPVRTFLDASGGRLEGERNEIAQVAMNSTVEIGVAAENLLSMACPSLTPEEEATLSSSKDEQKRMLRAALDQLKPEDANIIKKLKLDDPPMKPEELAQEMGITRDRVRQLEGRALLRLRKRLIDGGFGLHALT